MIEVLILAAGVGSRLDPLTRTLPKPALPLGDSTIVGQLVAKARKLGITSLRSNLHHRPEHMSAALREAADGLRVDARREPVLTGPAGALHAFDDVLGTAEAIVVVSGDVSFDDDLAPMVTAHLESGAMLTVATAEVLDGHRFGVFQLDPSGTPTGFVEKPAWARDRPHRVSAGVYVVAPSLLGRIPHDTVYDFGADLIPALIHEPGALLTHSLQGHWDDLGDVATYRKAALRHASPTIVHPTASIHPTAELRGVVHIAPGARIGAHAVVRDSVVLPGAVIPPHQLVCDAVIGTAPHREDTTCAS
jgi:NDP-sugar pyrophosphorylase family protein